MRLTCPLKIKVVGRIARHAFLWGDLTACNTAVVICRAHRQAHILASSLQRPHKPPQRRNCDWLNKPRRFQSLQLQEARINGFVGRVVYAACSNCLNKLCVGRGEDYRCCLSLKRCALKAQTILHQTKERAQAASAWLGAAPRRRQICVRLSSSDADALLFFLSGFWHLSTNVGTT